MTTNELLILSRPWTRGSGAPNPALIYLTKMNAKAEKGWLRKAEADKADRDRDVPTAKKVGQLSTREKQLVLSLKQTLDSAGDTVAAAMASAWGVTSKTVRRIQNQSLKVDGLAAPRKERFDKGDTVFTSDAKRKQVYTPLSSEERGALFQIDGGHWKLGGDGNETEVQFVKVLYADGDSKHGCVGCRN
jgi:hypothetical protein